MDLQPERNASAKAGVEDPRSWGRGWKRRPGRGRGRGQGDGRGLGGGPGRGRGKDGPASGGGAGRAVSRDADAGRAGSRTFRTCGAQGLGGPGAGTCGCALRVPRPWRTWRRRLRGPAGAFCERGTGAGTRRGAAGTMPVLPEARAAGRAVALALALVLLLSAGPAGALLRLQPGL